MFTKPKFNKLDPKLRHKKCAELLKEYNRLASFLDIEPIEPSAEALTHRYHDHLDKADISVNEPDYLVRTHDRVKGAPFLPIDIYLDNIRSAHNVGSIIRTLEAFRLGTLHFGGITPLPTQKKVADTAMGSHEWIEWDTKPLDQLPGPKIALETVDGAPSLFDFTFPETFTLILGSEEFGVSQESLAQADSIVEIPLSGVKNSLNVANTFAIAAALIAKNL